MTTFREFRDGPAGDLARRMGLDISGCISWQHFTATAVAYNNCDAEKDDERGLLVKAARRLCGSASTGEKAVICALLHAADFAWLADELSLDHQGEPLFWTRLDGTYGDHLRAVAAAVLRQD